MTDVTPLIPHFLMFLTRKYPRLILEDFKTTRSIIQQYLIDEKLEHVLINAAEERMRELKVQ